MALNLSAYASFRLYGGMAQAIRESVRIELGSRKYPSGKLFNFQANLLNLKHRMTETAQREFGKKCAKALKSVFVNSMREASTKYHSSQGNDYSRLFGVMARRTSVTYDNGSKKIRIRVEHPLATPINYGGILRPTAHKALAVPILAGEHSSPAKFGGNLVFKPPAPGGKRSPLNESNFVGTLREYYGKRGTGKSRASYYSGVLFALYKRIQLPKVPWIPSRHELGNAIRKQAHAVLGDIRLTRSG